MPKLLDINKDWLQIRPKLKVVDNGWLFTGYQSYLFAGNEVIPSSDALQIKDSIIRPHLERLVKPSSIVLDLGCANLYFGILAHIFGAKKIIGVDIDKEYLSCLWRLIDEAELNTVEVIEKNVVEVKEKADIVIALAITHWIYSCTAFIGSLKKVVEFLGELTREVLFVEFIGTGDLAMKRFNHIDYNKELTKKDYNRKTFVRAINETFRSAKSIGFSKPGREIFLCIK